MIEKHISVFNLEAFENKLYFKREYFENHRTNLQFSGTIKKRKIFSLNEQKLKEIHIFLSYPDIFENNIADYFIMSSFFLSVNLSL